MPDELTVAAGSPFLTAEIYARVRLRILTRKSAFDDEISEDVNPTDFGQSYLQNSCNLALEALDFMERGSREG